MVQKSAFNLQPEKVQNGPQVVLSTGMVCWITPPVSYWGLQDDLDLLYSATKRSINLINTNTTFIVLLSNTVLSNGYHTDACILPLVILYTQFIHNMVSISLMCPWIDGWVYELSKDSCRTVIFAQSLACNLFRAKAVGSEWWAGMAPFLKTDRDPFPTCWPHFHSTNLYDINQSVLKTPEFTVQYFNSDSSWCLL